MSKLLCILIAGLLISGCATTKFEIDPTTKHVTGSTFTLFKSVEGFRLTWDTDENGNPTVTVNLEKSDPMSKLVDAMAPMLRELGPVVQGLAQVRNK